MKFKGIQLKYIVSALLNIFERNNSMRMSSIFNYFGLFCMIFHPLSYIIKLNLKIYDNPKMLVINNIIFFVNYINCLHFLQIDILTYLIFGLSLFLLLILLTIFMLNTIILQFNLSILGNSKILNILNSLAQRISYIFNPICLIPILEICINIENCDILKSFRNVSNCESNLIALKALSIIGLMSTSILGLLLVSLNRSYNFIDPMILRPRLNFSEVLVFLCKVCLVAFWPLHENMPIITFLLINFIWIIYSFDFIMKIKYVDKNVQKFYLCCLLVNIGISFMYTLENYTEFFNQEDFFYSILIIVLLASKVANFIAKKVNKIILSENFENDLNFGFSLEYLYLLNKDAFLKENFFEILGILKQHVNACSDPECVLTKKRFNRFHSSGFEEKEYLIIQFISQLFSKYFEKNVNLAKKDSNFFDELILKYCTFLSNINKNPIKSYYEILYILSLKKTKNFYFKHRSLKILKKVKDIILTQEKLGSFGKDKGSKEIDVRVYFEILKEKNAIKENVIDLLRRKINFLEFYKEGVYSYEKIIMNLFYFVPHLKSFENFLSKNLGKKKENSKKIFSLKFQIIYNCLILNNVNEGIKIEDELDKLKKKEMTLDTAVLNCNSFFYDNLVTVQASYLSGNGSIVESSKTLKLAKFFDYSLEEFKAINHINSFMPEIISSNHKVFVKNIIHNTENKNLEERRFFTTFAKDKNNYIFPIKIYVGYSFDFRFDFVFHSALIDLGLKNEKIILFTNEGEFAGVSKECFLFFEKLHNKLTANQMNLLNLFCFIPSLQESIEKNNMFKENINGILANQTSLLILPKNFDEIYEVSFNSSFSSYFN